MTYAEQRENTPFDWWSFLNQGVYYQSQLYKARSLANDWVTCACGNQCAIIQRDNGGKPVDETLKNLGVEFLGQIINMRLVYSLGHMNLFDIYRRKALRILHAIELRSAKLIKDEIKRKNQSG